MAMTLKDELITLKDRLETIEGQLSGQMKEIEDREAKWKRLDPVIENIISTQSEVVKLNIGGKQFSTSVSTLKKLKGSFFDKLFETGKVDLNEEIFIDRSHLTFSHLLNFLRTNEIDYKRLNERELSSLLDDSEFYGISKIFNELMGKVAEIEMVDFEQGESYVHGGKTAGTGKLSDLKNKNMKGGICSNSPGLIIIHLNYDFIIESLEIGGWKGNTKLWSPDHGAGAEISISSDKVEWTKVGEIPIGFGNTPAKVNLTKVSGRYLKFEKKDGYLGIGYLKLNKAN